MRGRMRRIRRMIRMRRMRMIRRRIRRMVVDGWLDGYVDGCGWLMHGFSMVVDGYWMVFWMVVDGYWMVIGWLFGWLLDG